MPFSDSGHEELPKAESQSSSAGFQHSASSVARDPRIVEDHEEQEDGTVAVVSPTTKADDVRTTAHDADEEPSCDLTARRAGADSDDIEQLVLNEPQKLFMAGVRLFEEEEYSKALDCFRRSLGKERESTMDVARILRWMGLSAYLLRDLDLAVGHFHQHVQILKNNDAVDDDACQLMGAIGRMLFDMNRFEEAVAAFLDRLEFARTIYGSDSVEVAATLGWLGRAYFELDDLDSSLDCTKQALQVQLAVCGPGHCQVRDTYLRLSVIHTQRDELEESMECLAERARLEKEHSDDPLATLESVIGLARLYWKLGRFDEALGHYCDGLALQKEHNATGFEISDTLQKIGLIKYRSGDHEGAMDVQQECLRIRRELEEAAEDGVVEILVDISATFISMEEFSAALDTLLEADRAIRTLKTPDTKYAPFVRFHIALMQEKHGRADLALPTYLDLARMDGPEFYRVSCHSSSDSAFFRMGVIYWNRGETDLAFESVEQALVAARKCLGDRAGACARALNCLGDIELERGSLEEALQLYVEAARACPEFYESADELDTGTAQDLWRFELVCPHCAGAA